MSGSSRRKGRRYPEAFRKKLVDLVWSGRTPEELAREHEPSAGTIRRWMAQTDPQQELRALRRRVRIAEEEVEFLKKARAWVEADQADEKSRKSGSESSGS